MLELLECFTNLKNPSNKKPFLSIKHTRNTHERSLLKVQLGGMIANEPDAKFWGRYFWACESFSDFRNETLEMKSFCCWFFLYNLERISLIERQIESSHDLVKFSEDEQSFWINKSHKPKQMVAWMEAASFLKSNLLICFFPNKEFPKVGYDRCRSNLQFIIKHPGAEIVFNAFLLLLSSKSFHIYSIDLMAKRNCKRT